MPDAHSNETFREIPGFPGYRVSNRGKVQSRKRLFKTELSEEWKDLRLSILKKYGYRYVRFRQKGKRFIRYVHRLVLECFIGPCPEGMECCHEDGDPTNNRLENLRWDTHQQNILDAVHQGHIRGPGMRGEDHPQAKLTKEEVEVIRALRLEGWLLKPLALRFRVCETTISRIVRRRSWRPT